jgi:hypothetical protein
VTVNGFQDRRIRPLCHLSGAKIRQPEFLTKLIDNIILVKVSPWFSSHQNTSPCLHSSLFTLPENLKPAP